MSLPPLPDKRNTRGKLETPLGKTIYFTIVDQIYHFQSDFPEKALVLQKIRFDDGNEELRLAYYIIGKKAGMKGKWVWGQFATFMPKNDFVSLFKEAEKRGWF